MTRISIPGQILALPPTATLPFEVFTITRGRRSVSSDRADMAGVVLEAVQVPQVPYIHTYIAYFGGLLFGLRRHAETAAFILTFPEDSVEPRPNPKGRFVNIGNLPVFVPEALTAPLTVGRTSISRNSVIPAPAV